MKLISLLFYVKLLHSLVVGQENNCGVVPITAWSGAASRREEKLSRPINMVVIQHTATPTCSIDAECEHLTKNIQSYHVNQLNFTDIGQSFLIGGNGKVYEGAGWSHVGAHTRYYNNKSISIAFIGTFIDELPTDQALQAAKSLMVCGVESKYLSENYHLVGHRQLSSTESPGTELYNLIQSWEHWTNDAKSI